jgi:hypothetical protein
MVSELRADDSQHYGQWMMEIATTPWSMLEKVPVQTLDN